MSKRYWFYVFAFGLVALAADPQNGWAQERSETSSKEVSIPLPAFGLLNQSDKTNNLTKPCDPESDERDSDLCAQWKAADAAKKSADWSVSLGIGGVFIGILTLAAAFAAAKFAKSAANATWKTVEVTRKIGESQTRAYCNVDEVSGTRVSVDPGDPNFRLMHATVRIKNFGQTPAFQASGWAFCTSFSRSEGKLRERPKSIRAVSRMPLGGGGTDFLTAKKQFANDTDIEDEEIIIHGFWVYRDCFGVKRLTKFRYALDKESRCLLPTIRGNYST